MLHWFIWRGSRFFFNYIFFTVCLLTFRSDLAAHVRVLHKLVLDAEKMCLYNGSHPQLRLQEILFKWYKLIFLITVWWEMESGLGSQAAFSLMQKVIHSRVVTWDNRCSWKSCALKQRQRCFTNLYELCLESMLPYKKPSVKLGHLTICHRLKKNRITLNNTQL